MSKTRRTLTIWAPDELPSRDVDRIAYLTLSNSAWIDVLTLFAGRLARLRHAADVGQTAEEATIEAAWSELAPRARVARAGVQLGAFTTARADDGFAEVTRWLSRPIEEGWGVPADLVPTRDEFDEQWAATRDELEGMRSADTPIARLWRRHHPGWRKGMKPQHVERFDKAMEDEVLRLSAWFKDHPATR